MVRRNIHTLSVCTPLINNTYPGTILAYGQTSSGKTYTMLGPEKSSADTDVTPSTDEERGIIPRTLQDIFQVRTTPLPI